MLGKIIILLICLLVVPDLYIYFRYVRKMMTCWCCRLLTFLPSALLTVFMCLLMHSNEMKPDNQPLLGVFMIVFMLFCIPKMLFTLIDASGLLVGSILPWRTVREGVERPLYRRFRIAALCVSIFSVMVLLFGYFYGRNHFVVRHQTYCFYDLPDAFDGYRIAQFTDLHIGTMRAGREAEVDTIVQLINSQQCDAVMFTGDAVNHMSIELDGFKRVLSKLSAPDGVYSIMGNHDYSMYIRYASEAERAEDVKELQRKERSYGWRLLLNEHVVVRRGADSIIIAGVENDGEPPFPQYGDLPATFKGLKGVMRSKNNKPSVSAPFTILLSHDPTHWKRSILPETNVQLTLSGHTHASQFKVFGWSPVQYRYPEWSGTYIEGSQILNVSDGIGAVMFPFRFGAWPEINVITLKKAVRRNKK